MDCWKRQWLVIYSKGLTFEVGRHKVEASHFYGSGRAVVAEFVEVFGHLLFNFSTEC